MPKSKEPFVWPTLTQENSDYNVLTLHDYLSIILGRPIATDSEFELTNNTISYLKDLFKNGGGALLQNRDGSIMNANHWRALITKAVQMDMYSVASVCVYVSRYLISPARCKRIGFSLSTIRRQHHIRTSVRFSTGL